jgi:hypothetical protein
VRRRRGDGDPGIDEAPELDQEDVGDVLVDRAAVGAGQCGVPVRPKPLVEVLPHDEPVGEQHGEQRRDTRHGRPVEVLNGLEPVDRASPISGHAVAMAGMLKTTAGPSHMASSSDHLFDAVPALLADVDGAAAGAAGSSCR